MHFLPGQVPLYFVTDHNLNGGRAKLDVIASALRGGAKLIQFRDKVLGDVEFESEARAALALCRKHAATMLVDDRVLIARKIRADGVHLGQEDMDPAEARTLLGPDALIGFSTHDEAEVRAAQKLPVSYINIGPMFPTGTKQHLHALGLDEVLRLSKLTAHPWTTMGGIKQSHLPELFQRGVKTVSMVTEISLAADVESKVAEILEMIPMKMPVILRELPGKGKSLFATQAVSKGEGIGYFKGNEIVKPTQHSITSHGRYFEPTSPLGFLNHACSPNAFFSDRWLIASRDIQSGEELTLDYLATESEITHGFACACGAANCRGWIGNA